MPPGGYGAGQLPELPANQPPKGGVENGLSPADFQDRAEGVPVLPAEQLHHLHRNVVLTGLQEAAVDEDGHRGPVPGRMLLQRFQEVQQRHGDAVRIEGKHQQQVGIVLQLPAELQMVGLCEGKAGALPRPGPDKQLGIPPGVGSGRPGACVYQHDASHASTSSLTICSRSCSAANTTRWRSKFMFRALRATSRRNSARSASDRAP